MNIKVLNKKQKSCRSQLCIQELNSQKDQVSATKSEDLFVSPKNKSGIKIPKQKPLTNQKSRRNSFQRSKPSNQLITEILFNNFSTNVNESKKQSKNAHQKLPQKCSTQLTNNQRSKNEQQFASKKQQVKINSSEHNQKNAKIQSKNERRKQKFKSKNKEKQLSDHDADKQLRKINDDAFEYNPTIKDMFREFQRQVMEPIEVQDKIHSSGMCQRCPIHKNPFSLYCTIDHTPLCVSCMYQSGSHRHHRVVPIKKCGKELTEDIENFKNKIESLLSESENLSRKCNIQLISLEREYPALVHRIETYYFQIHDMIQKKKKQQLEELQKMRKQFKVQYRSVANFLNQLNNYIQEKGEDLILDNVKRKFEGIKPANKGSVRSEFKNLVLTKQKDTMKAELLQKETIQRQQERINEDLLNKRCKAETLAKCKKLLREQSSLCEERTFSISLQHFYQVFEIIKYKLTLVLPIMTKAVTDKQKAKSFTNLAVQHQSSDAKKQYTEKNQDSGGKKKTKTENEAPNFGYSLNARKPFSLSPQAPRGLSQRFIQIQPKLSPKRERKFA